MSYAYKQFNTYKQQQTQYAARCPAIVWTRFFLCGSCNKTQITLVCLLTTPRFYAVLVSGSRSTRENIIYTRPKEVGLQWNFEILL